MRNKNSTFKRVNNKKSCETVGLQEEKVNELIASAASAYEDPTEVIEYYKNNEEMKQQMQNVALEEQAVEFLLAKAQVTDKKSSFKDIMNPEAK